MTSKSNKLPNPLYFIVGILLLVLIGIGIYYASLYESQPRVVINNHDFPVEIVDTETARAAGLSGRDELETSEGMLFVYQEPEQPKFWMKDMEFPLDIVWISEDNEITAIHANVHPETYPQTFSPPEPVLYVLEINAGEASAFNLKVGQEVVINP